MTTLNADKNKNRATRPTREDRTMRRMLWIVVSIFAVSITAGANAQTMDWRVFEEPFVTSAHAQEIDWQAVDDAFGRKPAVSGDVHRYGFPRTDLTVTLDGVTIKPALALGVWIPFNPPHECSMAIAFSLLLSTSTPPS